MLFETCSEAPDITVTGFVAAPRLELLVTDCVPLLTVIDPVYVLLPLTTHTLVSLLTRAPIPLTTPLKLSLPVDAATPPRNRWKLSRFTGLEMSKVEEAASKV